MGMKFLLLILEKEIINLLLLEKEKKKFNYEKKNN